MATDHENAETRRQERRDEANKDYQEKGDDMRQGGPDPDLPHRMRSRPGDGDYDPNVQAEDGTSDGVAAKVGSSGQNASKRPGEDINDKNKAPDRLDGRNTDGGDIKD